MPMATSLIARLIAVASLALAATAARSADLGDPYGYGGAAAAPAYVAQPWSWTGFYVGAQAGYSWADSDFADMTGALGGATVGINGQYGSVVFGAEADFSFAGIEGTGGRFTHDVNWLSTVRGRIGYAFDRFMVYGTGGVALASSELSRGRFSDTQTHLGWTAGLGIEAGITANLSAKIEYLYVGLDKETYSLPGPVATDVSTNIIRIGLNYRF